MRCAIIGTLAAESRQRELDWVNFGCNVFEAKKTSNVDLYHFGLKKIYTIILNYIT